MNDGAPSRLLPERVEDEDLVSCTTTWILARSRAVKWWGHEYIEGRPAVCELERSDRKLKDGIHDMGGWVERGRIRKGKKRQAMGRGGLVRPSPTEGPVVLDKGFQNPSPVLDHESRRTLGHSNLSHQRQGRKFGGASTHLLPINGTILSLYLWC